MPERKSSRARKSVDYARFGGDGDIDDDDFAESTPPVTKRAKLSNKENVEKTKEKKKSENKPVSRKEPKMRSSVEEKMFERELQAALELSLSQSDPSQEAEPKETVHTSVVADAPPNIVDVEDDRAPSPILPRIENPPVLQKVGCVDDDIEVLEENVENVPSSRRRAAKPKKYVDSDSDSGDGDFEIDLRKFLRSPLTPKCKRRKKTDDSDFAPDADSDNESEDDFKDNDDSDSDFGEPKKKTAKKASNSTPKPTTSKQSAGKVMKTNAAKPADSDFAPDADDADSDNESEDDFKDNGDSDSDFGEPKKKTAKKASTSTPKPTTSKQSSGKVMKTNAAKPAVTAKAGIAKLPVTKVVKHGPVKTAVKSITTKSPAITSPAARAPASGLTKKTPNWTPPGQVGLSKSPLGGVTIKSPSTGLRIGLSRNMKLKPLHPKVKMV